MESATKQANKQSQPSGLLDSGPAQDLIEYLRVPKDWPARLCAVSRR